MDRRTAGHEGERTVRIAFFRQFRRQIAVFDDVQLAARNAEVAEFFIRTGLGEHDRAHVGSFQIVQSDEQRIAHFHQRVVDLEVADDVGIFLFHALQRAGFAQRQQRPAVPVRRERQRILGRQEKLAVVSDRRHRPLGEEEHLFRFESEVSVAPEEVDRRLAVEHAGHDIPRERASVFDSRAQDRAREETEETVAADGADGIGALGSVEAEARPLPSGDGEAADPAALQRRFAGGGSAAVEFAGGVILRDQRKERRGSQIVRYGGLRFSEHVAADQTGQFRPVDLGQLPRQLALARLVQFVPKTQDFRLSGGLDLLQKCGVDIHGERSSRVSSRLLLYLRYNLTVMRRVFKGISRI